MKTEYANFEKCSENIQARILDSETGLKYKALSFGFLGRVFGSAEHASKNIAGFVSVFSLLVAAAISVVSACKTGVPNNDIWTIVVPLLSGSLGYLFGQSRA